MTKRTHAKKIVAQVVDHVPRQITWHVIECTCGWSSALHSDIDSCVQAYQNHGKRKKRAA